MKYFLTIAFFSIFFMGKAQETSVNKSLYGIQTGFLGIWSYNESRLSNSIALRSEIGFDSGIWGSSFYDKTNIIIIPALRVEPRFYYNLNKRIAKSKKTENNSGNFISLRTSFHPDWFVISNSKNLNIISDISIIPTWGIRRQIGKHFCYESGIGFGYIYTFAKKAGYEVNESRETITLNLRIGYTF